MYLLYQVVALNATLFLNNRWVTCATTDLARGPLCCAVRPPTTSIISDYADTVKSRRLSWIWSASDLAVQRNLCCTSSLPMKSCVPFISSMITRSSFSNSIFCFIVFLPLWLFLTLSIIHPMCDNSNLLFVIYHRRKSEHMFALAWPLSVRENGK